MNSSSNLGNSENCASRLATVIQEFSLSSSSKVVCFVFFFFWVSIIIKEIFVSIQAVCSLYKTTSCGVFNRIHYFCMSYRVSKFQKADLSCCLVKHFCNIASPSVFFCFASLSHWCTGSTTELIFDKNVAKNLVIIYS